MRGVTFNNMSPLGCSVVELANLIGIVVFAEGSKTKWSTRFAIAIFTFVNANLMPVNKFINLFFLDLISLFEKHIL